MPFRSAAATLLSAAQSILDQEFRDLELIAIDDGSTDGSARLLQTIRDDRLVVIRNPGPQGIVGAMNAGIRRAGGSWIARMDADDLSLPGRLAAQVATAKPGDDVVTCGARLIDACGEGMERYVAWVNSLSLPDQIANARFVECPVIHPSAMVRRERLIECGGYREAPWAEDHDLWLRLLASGCRIVRAPGTHLLWRDSPDRLTRRDPRYGAAARSRMRAHFLAKDTRVREGGVVIAGAGPIGKRLARDLWSEGVELRGFFELNPRRIGQTIHGAPVASAEQMGSEWRECVLLGAVGVNGGRSRVRSMALETGRREGFDFWSVC